MQKQWKDLEIDIPLTIIYTPYRDIISQIDNYVSERERDLKDGETLTVVLTRISGNAWKDTIYHNQTTFFIEKILRRHESVATTLGPYFYNKPKKETHVAK